MATEVRATGQKRREAVKEIKAKNACRHWDIDYSLARIDFFFFCNGERKCLPSLPNTHALFLKTACIETPFRRKLCGSARIPV
jgi:hypothetical protein